MHQDLLAITVKANNLSTIKLYIDNSLVSSKSVAGASYTFTLQYTAYNAKTYTVRVDGLDSTNAIVKTASASWVVV